MTLGVGGNANRPELLGITGGNRSLNIYIDNFDELKDDTVIENIFTKIKGAFKLSVYVFKNHVYFVYIILYMYTCTYILYVHVMKL